MDRDTIKLIAHVNGKTLKGIALEMGITEVGLHQSLRAIETGGVTLGTLERIANAIGCSVADFYTYNQPTPTQCKCPKCGASLKLTLTTED